MDHQGAVAACRQMLELLDITGDEDTPARFVKAMAELTAGLRDEDPLRHLEVTFPPVSDEPGLVAVRGLPFTSVCEHHLLPFHGTATLAYLPKPAGRIVGLSKLARLVQELAARPQVQERLAAQVLDGLMTRLSCRGAAVGLSSVHTCMTLRGARTGPGAAMATVDYAGELADAPWRGEFAAMLPDAP